jgi:hypothetical protein
MSTQEAFALAYVAAALKFCAVPAAAFELLGKARREALESWLVVRLPQWIGALSITLLVLYVSVALLVKAGPYLVLVFFLGGRLIGWFVFASLDQKQAHAFQMSMFVFSIAVTVAAVVEKWVIPEAWIVAAGYPFETVSTLANSDPLLDWLLPDYSGQGFLDEFRRVFDAVENWLWSWLAVLGWGYFFFARGVMLLMVVLIQLLLALGVVLVALIVLGFPLYAFVKLSDVARMALRIDKERIPLGALILWATGETIEFALKTHEMFWK